MAAQGLTKRRTHAVTGLTGACKSANHIGEREQGLQAHPGNDHPEGKNMADDDYKRGEMDITTQQKTFDGFIRWSVNIGIACIAVVVFLAIFAR